MVFSSKTNKAQYTTTSYLRLTLVIRRQLRHCRAKERQRNCFSLADNIQMNVKVTNRTYSGGDPLKLNDVKTTSTRCPGPAKKIYRHWRE